MNVPVWAWLVTVLGLLVLLAVDLVIVDRKPHEVTIAEAGRWVVFYVMCAVGFGALIWAVAGSGFAGEFFSGYLTEYSLSVDNLVVFLVIMSAFRVPAIHQHRVLLVGIVIALFLRALLISIGAVLISEFTAVFYLFGAFLIVAAYRMVRSPDHPDDQPADVPRDNAALRLLRRLIPVTEQYAGARSFVRHGRRWAATPMLVVMVTIGTTDLLFALDSIPAVFGLTREPYLVFAVNAFALMGLRQLYFLIGGMLNKLIYLPVGLAVLLLFIGVKLIFEVIHEDWQPFQAGRQPLPVPSLGPGMSLGVIVAVLAITVVASLIRAHRAD